MTSFPKKTKEDAVRFAKSLLTGVYPNAALDFAKEMCKVHKHDSELYQFYTRVVEDLKQRTIKVGG